MTALGGAARVLVIDNSSAVRAEIGQVLGARGISVASCASGYEAVARLPGAVPDLLICDLVLPDVDGYQICRWLRQVPQLAATRVLLISSIVDDEVEREVEKLGVVGVLKKPLDAGVLLAVAERVLGLPATSTAGQAAGVALDLAPDADSHAPAEAVLDLAPSGSATPAAEQVLDLSPAAGSAAEQVLDLGSGPSLDPDSSPGFEPDATPQAPPHLTVPPQADRTLPEPPSRVSQPLSMEARQVVMEVRALVGFRLLLQLAPTPSVLALAGDTAAGTAAASSELLARLLGAADVATFGLGIGQLGSAVLEADAGTLVVRREGGHGALVLVLSTPAAVGKGRLLLARLQRLLPPADLDVDAGQADAN